MKSSEQLWGQVAGGFRRSRGAACAARRTASLGRAIGPAPLPGVPAICGPRTAPRRAVVWALAGAEGYPRQICILQCAAKTPSTRFSRPPESPCSPSVRILRRWHVQRPPDRSHSSCGPSRRPSSSPHRARPVHLFSSDQICPSNPIDIPAPTSSVRSSWALPAPWLTVQVTRRRV